MPDTLHPSSEAAALAARCRLHNHAISVTPTAAYRWCQPTTWIDPVEARAALAELTVETDERPLRYAADRDVWTVHPDPENAPQATEVALYPGETVRVEINRHRAKGPLAFWTQVTGHNMQLIAIGGAPTFAAAMAFARETLERWAANEGTDRSRCAS